MQQLSKTERLTIGLQSSRPPWDNNGFRRDKRGRKTKDQKILGGTCSSPGSLHLVHSLVRCLMRPKFETYCSMTHNDFINNHCQWFYLNETCLPPALIFTMLI